MTTGGIKTEATPSGEGESTATCELEYWLGFHGDDLESEIEPDIRPFLFFSHPTLPPAQTISRELSEAEKTFLDALADTIAAALSDSIAKRAES